VIEDEAIWKLAEHTWRIETQAVAQLGRCIEREALVRCVQVIAECRGRVVTSGCGTSAAAAKKIAHSLCCVERPAFFVSPSDAVHGGLGAVQPSDVAVLLSKGGGTAELLSLLPALKTKKVFIIGVTENPRSPLAKASDLLLRVKVQREADDFNMLATASSMAVAAVFDAVCVALMRYTGYTREQFAVIHPGGAVGERLLGEKS
jgi:KpsF/GutQ family protein